MPYAFLADFVLVVHLAFIAFVILGGLLVLWRSWVTWLHLPAVLWGTLIEFVGWPCPLTPLEGKLRALAGERRLGGGFIEEYLLPIIYPGALTRSVQIVLGFGVIVANVLVYWFVLRRRLRLPRRCEL